MDGFVRADDGVRLWCDDEGDGPAIVLSHGGPGMWDYLEPFAAALSPALRTVRWEQRGCGRSDATGPHTVARTVDDLEAVRLGRGLERWIVAGHSWGATVAPVSYTHLTLPTILRV